MDPNAPPALIAIVGPTGSGKSAVALSICETFSGEVVNCDSLQLYRGFQIGTAKTPSSERRGIRHHLIDVLTPEEEYSAGAYSKSARSVIAELSALGSLPVVVGGTGFYLQALLNGLPALPSRNVALRTRLMDRERKGPGTLHRILKRLEPQAASRIHINDTKKLIRALEIRLLTASDLPPIGTAEALTNYRILKIGLNPDRAQLHTLLDDRTREMFRAGLLDEVRELLAAGCTGEEKPFESIGYKQALQYVRGAITLDQAIASTQIETRQYAKRQWTWFRRDEEVQWVPGFGHSPSVIEGCLEAVQRFL